MTDLKVFDKRMYDNIKEDFKRGGTHEKVFKCIMLFIFCVFIIFMIFVVRYNTRPATFQVCDAYYVEKEASEYYVSTFYIDAEVDGKVKEDDYETFVDSVMVEYKSEFKDAYVMIVRFYSKYQIDERTGKPDRNPMQENRRYLFE